MDVTADNTISSNVAVNHRENRERSKLKLSYLVISSRAISCISSREFLSRISRCVTRFSSIISFTVISDSFICSVSAYCVYGFNYQPKEY